MRGGYLDLSVLGGLQVSGRGDLANWYVPGGQTGVGGAMDLVQGAKRVWVAMEHTDRFGRPKIVGECTLAPTGLGVVGWVYTELGVFSLEKGRWSLPSWRPGCQSRMCGTGAGRPSASARASARRPGGRYGEGQESLPHREDPLIYELRTYHCMPGKLPELLARFKNLTLSIWERHQIRQVGFWTVVVGESSTDLIYMLAWDSLAEREERWDKFIADPDWVRGRAATEENGQLVASVSNSLLRPTEFSALQGWPM